MASDELETWGDCMNIEPELLESDIRFGSRFRSFLPGKKGEAGKPFHSKDYEPPWTSEKLILEKENPFENLKISSTAPLNEQEERQACGYGIL